MCLAEIALWVALMAVLRLAIAVLSTKKAAPRWRGGRLLAVMVRWWLRPAVAKALNARPRRYAHGLPVRGRHHRTPLRLPR